jgi:teichuronic acid biosynthesis glycosyltransferase TuaG
MISILMPLHNGIEFINESVYSVISQTYPSWELIIGVNGFPSNSTVYETAKDMELLDERIRVLDFPEIKGKPAALNEMIKHCINDYVAILDVDDIWLSTKLELQVPFLANYSVVGTQCVYFGEIDDVIPNIPNGDISQYDFKIVNPIINSSSIIKKGLCYWDDVFGVEDYDMWLRLRSQGETFYNCSEVLVRHRIHSQSAFNSKDTSDIIKLIKEKYHFSVVDITH